MGGIIGVFAAVHLAMEALGLKGLIVLGAGLDIALGLALLWRFAPRGVLARIAAAAGRLDLIGPGTGRVRVSARRSRGSSSTR